MLKELRQQYSELMRNFNLNLEDFPMNSRFGIEGLKKKAAADLEELRPQLIREILLDTSILGFVDRLPRPKLMAKLTEKFEPAILIHDWLELEKQYVDQMYVTQRSGPYTINSTTSSILTVLVSDTLKSLNVLSAPVVHIPASQFSSFATKEEVVLLVEQFLTKTYEYDLKKLYLGMVFYEFVTKRIHVADLGIAITNLPAEALNAIAPLVKSIVAISEDTSIKGIVHTKDTEDLDGFLKKVKTNIRKIV